MEESGQNPVIIPPQTIEKPPAVTVFGILSIVFGGLGLICTPFSVLGIFIGDILPMGRASIEMAPAYKIILLVSSIVGIGFSAWLLALGIGLVKMKSWARRGSLIYSVIAIVWTIAGMALNIIAMSMQWINIPKEGLPGFIGGTCGGMVGMIYPVLLLIFMKTQKVKQAFAAVGG